MADHESVRRLVARDEIDISKILGNDCDWLMYVSEFLLWLLVRDENFLRTKRDKNLARFAKYIMKSNLQKSTKIIKHSNDSQRSLTGYRPLFSKRLHYTCSCQPATSRETRSVSSDHPFARALSKNS